MLKLIEKFVEFKERMVYFAQVVKANVVMIGWIINRFFNWGFKYNDIKVIHDNNFLSIRGLSYACAFRFVGIEYIIVDDLFMEASAEVQDFLLAHEYGHLSHPFGMTKEDFLTKHNNRMECILDNRVYAEEGIADDYAVSVVGAVPAIDALEKVQNELRFVNYFGNREIDLRINRIRSEHDVD